MARYAIGVDNSHADARSRFSERCNGGFERRAGGRQDLDQGGTDIPLIATVMLIPGMELASLLSLKWLRILDLARLVGPALALLTIALGLTHVIAEPIMIFGIDLIKGFDAWTRRENPEPNSSTNAAEVFFGGVVL